MLPTVVFAIPPIIVAFLSACFQSEKNILCRKFEAAFDPAAPCRPFEVAAISYESIVISNQSAIYL